MALSGTLLDLGIVDLIQFPGTGKKTGELIIAGIEDEARLFYEAGNLRHVTSGNHNGIDALVELLSWEEGEFEFRMGSTETEVSIEMDLHRALMVALQTRDERREKERQRAKEQEQELELEKEKQRAKAQQQLAEPTPPKKEIPHLQLHETITQAAQKHNDIEYASVYDKNGTKLCDWSKDEEKQDVFDQMIGGIITIFKNHPRDELQKLYITDSLGTCIGSSIDNDHILFLAAGDESSLGVISIAASKIATAVLEKHE